jgi:hypothetical protein
MSDVLSIEFIQPMFSGRGGRKPARYDMAATPSTQRLAGIRHQR